MTALIAYIAERGGRLKAVVLWWGALATLALVVFLIAHGMDEKNIDLIIPSTTVPAPPTTAHR